MRSGLGSKTTQFFARPQIMKGGRKNLEMKKMTLKPRTTLTYEWDTKRGKTKVARDGAGQTCLDSPLRNLDAKII